MTHAALRLDLLEDAMRAAVGDDEYLVHYELIVQTRSGPGASQLFTRHASMAGADPHLSYALLDVQAALEKQKIVSSEAWS